MGFVNKAMLMGNLVKQPETVIGKSETAYCNFTIAINSKFKETEETLFANCICFGKTAEFCGKLAKGTSLFIEARIVNETWQDKETGATRNATKFNVSQLTCCSKLSDFKNDNNTSSSKNTDISSIEDLPENLIPF